MALRILSPPGVVASTMRSTSAPPDGAPQQFDGGLIEFEDLTLPVGDDDRLENGAHDRVDELKLHLAAARFCFAKVAQADGETVELGSDGAEVVFGTPLDALMEIALADPSSYARGMTQRGDDQKEHDRGNDRSSGNGEAAGGDQAGAESVLLAAQGRDTGVAERGELIEITAQLDVKSFERLRELS